MFMPHNLLAVSAEARSKPSSPWSKHRKVGPLQDSFLSNAGTQCGFCTPGVLMASTALLASNANPNNQEIADGLGGVLCRCAGYRQIIDSVIGATQAGPVRRCCPRRTNSRKGSRSLDRPG